MGRLFELVEAHRKAHEPYPPSYSRIAEQVGVSRQTLLNWRTPTKLIDKAHLTALAGVTGVPYQRVLDALLDDIGYLREDQVAIPTSRRRRGEQQTGESTDPTGVVVHFAGSGKAAAVTDRVAVTELADSARKPGKASRGQTRRAEADRAGEPDPVDDNDFEPR